MSSGGGAGKIDEYFHLVQNDLANRFARQRQQNSDTEAKGVAAERIFVETVLPYLQPTRATCRRQIIDRSGDSSDEVDVGCGLGSSGGHMRRINVGSGGGSK